MLKRLEQRVRSLERRLARIVQVGVVAEVLPQSARVRVRVGTERLSEPLPFLTQHAGVDRTWWPPQVGEQVLVLAPNGDAVAAVALGSLYQQDAPAPSTDPAVVRVELGDGAVFEYHRDQSRLTAALPGEAQVAIAGDATIEVGGEAHIDASAIRLNGGSGCVTGESICHFTGRPHADVSSTVFAGKS